MMPGNMYILSVHTVGIHHMRSRFYTVTEDGTSEMVPVINY